MYTYIYIHDIYIYMIIYCETAQFLIEPGSHSIFRKQIGVNLVPLAAIKGGRAVELAWHTEEGKEVKGVDFNIGSGAYPWLTLRNFWGTV